MTFSGALILNTPPWCHCWKLSELTVLSRAGPQIYILYRSRLQTFNLALILNPFSVNLPKNREVIGKKYNLIVRWSKALWYLSIDGNKMGTRKLHLPPEEEKYLLLAPSLRMEREGTCGHRYLHYQRRNYSIKELKVFTKMYSLVRKRNMDTSFLSSFHSSSK